MQPDAPDNGKQGNWLPIPQEGPFSYVLRIYGPGGNAMPMTPEKEPLKPDAISPVAVQAAVGGADAGAQGGNGDGPGRRGLRIVSVDAQ